MCNEFCPVPGLKVWFTRRVFFLTLCTFFIGEILPEGLGILDHDCAFGTKKKTARGPWDFMSRLPVFLDGRLSFPEHCFFSYIHASEPRD